MSPIKTLPYGSPELLDAVEAVLDNGVSNKDLKQLDQLLLRQETTYWENRVGKPEELPPLSTGPMHGPGRGGAGGVKKGSGKESIATYRSALPAVVVDRHRRGGVRYTDVVDTVDSA